MSTSPRRINSAIQRTGARSRADDRTDAVELSDAVRVSIDLLVVDGSPRLSGEDQGHVELLAESISALPPIVVHRATMRVIDGIHRLGAARLRGDTTVGATFFDGDENEAYVLSVKQNTTHGLPLTRADRRFAAQRIIEIHPEWSDRAIARTTGLSPKTVGSLRPRSTSDVEVPTTRVGLDGRVRPIDHRTGHRLARQYLARHPEATTEDVAQATGLSIRSARNARRRFTDDEQKQQMARHAQRPPGSHPGLPAAAMPGEILRTLRNDPSLRFTDGGRAFLQLLGASVPWDHNADQLIGNLPPHCIQALAEAMHTCARTCQAIAEKLEARHKNDATCGSPGQTG